jgi:hypothetical protein
MKHALNKSLVLILLISAISLKIYSQDSYSYQGKRYNPYLDRFSLGFGVGLSAYNGELSTFFKPKLQRYYLNPNLGIDFAWRYNNFISLKAETNFFLLYSESIPKYEKDNRIFWSYNFDYFASAVFDIIPQKRIDGRFTRWNGSIQGGIGQVLFFPQDNKSGGSKNGEVLGSDGVSTEYNFTGKSLIYPVGASVKYYIDKNQFISLTGIYRFTKTDFLDAFKDVQHPAFDSYFTLQFKYTVIFDSNPSGIFNYSKYQKTSKNSGNRH